MPFFQNPFDVDYRRSWLMGDDIHMAQNFKVGANKASDPIIAWNADTWDLTAPYDVLTINFAFDSTLRQFSTRSITVSGAVPAATKAAEVVAALNADPFFGTLFQAYVQNAHIGMAGGSPPPNTVAIKMQRGKQATRVYVSNTGAEVKMRFNKQAGYGQLPTYCMRDTIDNRFAFGDSASTLVYLSLDPAEVGAAQVAINQQIITEAGLDYTAVIPDWQYANGTSGIFAFKKYAYDGSGRTTTLIEYNAGAKVGDLAKKTTYTYTGANTYPDQVTAYPYTLKTADMLTPT
jgi:hypothetical protein